MTCDLIAVRPSRPHRAPVTRRDPSADIDAQAVVAHRLAGRPGHDSKAVLASQPVRIVAAFEAVHRRVLR